MSTALWVPPTLDDIVGNYQFVNHCKAVLAGWKGERISSLLLVGPPGTGKSTGQISFFRQLLKDPTLGYGEDAGLLSWMTISDRRYAFMRIDGDDISRPCLQGLTQTAKWSSADHVFVLIDEAGVLYDRGLHEDIRTLLTHPDVSVWANAQDFGRKGEKPTDQAKRERQAFLRRFDVDFETQLPKLADLVKHLAARARELGIGFDNPKTFLALAEVAGKVPAFAVRCFERVTARPKPWVLTAEIVAEYAASRLHD